MSLPPDPAETPKGPASYFSSIEKTYGWPIDQWIGLVTEQHAAGTVKHGQLVTWLTSEHGLGHGHANAVVAHTLRQLAAGT